MTWRAMYGSGNAPYDRWNAGLFPDATLLRRDLAGFEAHMLVPVPRVWLDGSTIFEDSKNPS